MFERSIADHILDGFSESPGTMTVYGVDPTGSRLGPAPEHANRLLEAIKARAVARGITIEASVQHDPGNSKVLVQHIVD